MKRYHAGVHILWQCHLTSIAFHFIYGFGRLQQRTIYVLINFNHMTILLKRGMLVAF